jgi:hypothetical protein
VPFKYHCPGGDEAIDGSEAFAPNDVVVVECDENNVPQRVVGHYDGAEQCNIFYCVAWFASNYIYLKYNDVNRWFDCWDAVRDAYDAKGRLSDFNGFSGVVSIQYADNYPFRLVICLELNGNALGEFWLGRYCFIDVEVDPDNNYIPVGTVHFYGILKFYDLYPYFDSYTLVECAGGTPIPHDADDWNTDDCPGIQFSNTCTAGGGTLGCYCLDDRGPGSTYFFQSGIVPCNCSERACPCKYPCGFDNDPGECEDDPWWICCNIICDSVNGTISIPGNLQCKDCMCNPLPVGTYAVESMASTPDAILAGGLYYEHFDFKSEEDYSDSCGDPGVVSCDPDHPIWSTVFGYWKSCGCDSCLGGGAQHYDHWNSLVPNGCSGQLVRGMGVWYKNIDDVAAPDEDYVGVTLGSPDYEITDEQASDVWNPNFNHSYQCDPDYCQKGDLFRYSYTPQRMIGDNKWTYEYWRHTYNNQYDGVSSCECVQVDGGDLKESCVTVGFTYNFPATPDGEDPDDGGWRIQQNMLKGTLGSYAIAWIEGTGHDHYRTTNPLGENLPLASGLASPLDTPNRVMVLVSDLNDSGFTISMLGGKVRAYSSFEVIEQEDPPVDKIQPVGDPLYEWTVGFPNANAVMRTICFMVYQPPVT